MYGTSASKVYGIAATLSALVVFHFVGFISIALVI
jgi:hypothetical protein